MIQSVDITPGLEVKNYIEEDNISEKKKKQTKNNVYSYFVLFQIFKTPKSVTKYKTPPIELDKILFLKKNP